MPKLPVVSGKILVKAFTKKGTLKKGILNPLNISVEEFLKLLS